MRENCDGTIDQIRKFKKFLTFIKFIDSNYTKNLRRDENHGESLAPRRRSQQVRHSDNIRTIKMY